MPVNRLRVINYLTLGHLVFLKLLQNSYFPMYGGQLVFPLEIINIM
jgi:hypothetical protein